MKKTHFILLVIALLTSCSDSPDNYPNTKHYIFKYIYDIDQAEIKSSVEDNTYSLFFLGKEANGNDLNREKYESLAKQYKDESFNKSILWVFSAPVVADTITKIDFICKQPFDGIHPQNSNINDLIRLSFSSPKSYIDSGYELDENKVIQEPLTSFNKRRNILITQYIMFSFIQTPTNLKSCDITCIGYKDDDILFEVSQPYLFN